MACQRYPGCHCCAGQGGGFLEGQVAWQKHDCFFIEDHVFRQHSVEIGAEPVGQVAMRPRHDKTETLILMGRDRPEQQDSLITESLIRKFWMGYRRLMDV
jgi:hypothetical protein